MKRNTKGIVALLLAVIMIVSAFASCKLTDEPNDEEQPTEAAATEGIAEASAQPTETASPYGKLDNTGNEISGLTVVMRSDNYEITLYDYGQSFYNGRKLQYYMYGMLTPEQYCESVVDEVAMLLYLLESAKEAGVELTEEEIANADKIIDDQLEELLTRYEENAGEDVEDKHAAALEKLEEDLKNDGIDFDSFLKLAKGNIHMYNTADKYYKTLDDAVEISEEDVNAYITEQRDKTANISVSDFVQAVSGYNEGSSPYPVIIPDDCFSVNHIFLMFESDTDEEGVAHANKESRSEDEAKIEKLIGEAADYEAFMALESEYGEDPGMDNERYREYGYIIHPSLATDYFPGFVYAAMNLHEGGWTPPHDLENGDDVDYGERELSFFELKDGTKVVKVYTDSGVHYIIVNKEYKKGDVQYEIGDEFWQSWEDALKQQKMSEIYASLSEEWKAKYRIDVDMDSILAKYASNDEEGSGEEGAGEENTGD